MNHVCEHEGRGEMTTTTWRLGVGYYVMGFQVQPSVASGISNGRSADHDAPRDPGWWSPSGIRDCHCHCEGHSLVRFRGRAWTIQYVERTSKKYHNSET